MCTSQVSASRVLHRGTDSVGPAFCAFPRSEQLRPPGSCRAHCPRRVVHLITFLVPAGQFPGCAAGALSHGYRVPPLGSSSLTAALLVDVNRQLGACSQFGGGCHLGGQVCPLPSSSGCHLPVMAGLLSAFSLKAKYFVVYTTSSLSICPLAESEIVSISWLL